MIDKWLPVLKSLESATLAWKWFPGFFSDLSRMSPIEKSRFLYNPNSKCSHWMMELYMQRRTITAAPEFYWLMLLLSILFQSPPFIGQVTIAPICFVSVSIPIMKKSFGERLADPAWILIDCERFFKGYQRMSVQAK